MEESFSLKTTSRMTSLSVGVVGLFMCQIVFSPYTVNDGNRQRNRGDEVVDHWGCINVHISLHFKTT